MTTTPDLPVSAPAAEVPTIDPEQTAAEKTSAPGLPIKQPTLSDEFVIKFPDPRPDKERAQVIVSAVGGVPEGVLGKADSELYSTQ